MRIRRYTILWVFIFISYAFPLFADGMSGKEYLRFVPLSYPKIFTETDANKKFEIFGNKGELTYRDVDPVDGIDDQRFKILQRMAVRFAPILVQNTSAVPMDFKLFMRGRTAFPLYVDTWDISEEKSELVETQTVDFVSLGFSFENSDDQRLLSLIEEFHPNHPANEAFRAAKRSPRGELFKVLYFDFPGHDEKTWKEEYENEFSQKLRLGYQDFVKTYVHPFINEVSGKPNSPPGYEFIIQYWFFYPYNDGGNNHEGDWEHINVVISPMIRVNGLLAEDEIKDILEGKGLSNDITQSEQLVIKRVEYYFHLKVTILDYARANAYLPKSEWEKEKKNIDLERVGEDWLWKKIRWLAYIDDAETKINTHPIGFIGADNKGFDQLLAFPGGKNRDSHGNYPLPALYKGVGPGNASEQISVYFDHREFFRTAALKKQPKSNSYARGNAVRFDNSSKIKMVPDWERVIDLVESDSKARQEWAWLVLPIRWGYPAAASPFAGIIPHAETGNLAPFGPAYRDGWNLVGASVGYDLYQPHKFSSIFPLDWQDGYQNNLGFLNLTYPTLANLPPFDLMWRVVAAPFRIAVKRQNPTFYSKETIPFRFVGISGGVSIQTIPEEFVFLGYNEAQLTEIDEILEAIDPGHSQSNLGSTLIHERAVGGMFQVVFFMGKHFVSENTIRHSRSTVGEDVPLLIRADPLNIRGELNLWEYAGSLRYNLATGNFQPFLKAGYGLSWYRLEKVSTDGTPLSTPNSPWVRKPSLFPFKNILPNTWHYGFGFEIVPIKSYAPIPRGIDIGLRVEFINYYHPMGLDFEPWLGDVAKKIGDIKVTRKNLNLMLTISF